jgi:uncharacterized membrane protein YphA (DoxX/SURF4 family)
MYFKVAPGPIGEKMRKNFGDPTLIIAERVKASKKIDAVAFANLSIKEQAEACPPVVIAAIDASGMADKAETAVKTEAAKELKDADADEKKAIDAVNATEKKETEAAKNDEDKAKAKAKADEARGKIKASADKAREAAKKKEADAKEIAAERIQRAKASYARWVFGVDGRDCKVKIVGNGDVSLAAPARIEHLEWLRQQVQAAEARQAMGLGNGYGTDVKRASEWRMDLITAESDLAKDANAFIAELRKDLNGGTAIEEPTEVSAGQRLDKITMWFLVIVGSFLMAGLFTRLSCFLGAGFLVMTYLAHPPFPWYPLPPATEGNPVFINKNVIECLALLSLMCMPTGRWMGIDALVHRCLFGKETPVEQPVVATPTTPTAPKT